MRFLIQWPYSRYDEGYCAVIVSHDSDMAGLLEQAVYAVARHSDSDLYILKDANGRMPQPPYPACVRMLYGVPAQHVTLDDFALFWNGHALPRSGTLVEACLLDQAWLTLDWVNRK